MTSGIYNINESVTNVMESTKAVAKKGFKRCLAWPISLGFENIVRKFLLCSKAWLIMHCDVQNEIYFRIGFSPILFIILNDLAIFL